MTINATNTSKNRKLSRKLREQIVVAIELITFSETFIYDQLEVLSTAVGTVSIG